MPCFFILKDSVWSALPPINISPLQRSKPIVLITASMDSSSFFRDKSLGADSPISVSYISSTFWRANLVSSMFQMMWILMSIQGLISLLAAVDALSHLSGSSDVPKQVNFKLVFNIPTTAASYLPLSILYF